MNETLVRDIDEADFDRDVLARSKEVPVVVDFWAPWCAPCLTLGPVLEREVQALGGRVELVKVDTDKNPELSARFQIRGIPAVKAFRGGRLIDEFTGAQGAVYIRDFLARLAPSPDEAALERAISARKDGDNATVEAVTRELLQNASLNPSMASGAALLLASTLVDEGKTAEVESILARIDPRSPLVERADILREILALSAEADAYGGEAVAHAALALNENDLDARYALAAALAAGGRAPEALPHFLDLVSRSRKFKDDAARKAMLALFKYLGPDHALVQEYRRRLQIIA